MEAKDKARELINKFRFNCKHTEYVDDNRYKHNKTIKDLNAKQCALICVDEMIRTINEYQEFYGVGCLSIDELQQVKQEINKQ